MRYINRPLLNPRARYRKERVPLGAWLAALVTLVMTLALLWSDAGGF